MGLVFADVGHRKSRDVVRRVFVVLVIKCWLKE